jgi:hypothetical protein
METSNCTEPNDKQPFNRDMPPSVREIIDQSKFISMHNETKAFRDRLFESQIFANLIEHENRIKFLFDNQSKTIDQQNTNDIAFIQFMGLLAEFPNTRSKTFEKEWDTR